MGDPEQVDVSGLSIGYFADDGYFSPCPAIRRLVAEAAESLASLGCRVTKIRPPGIEEMVGIYFGIMSADGGANERGPWGVFFRHNWYTSRYLINIF